MTQWSFLSWSIPFEPTRAEVNQLLLAALPVDLVETWWDISLPTLGHRTANQLWAEGRGQEVYAKAKSYSEAWYN